jgi:hypothetical protein
LVAASMTPRSVVRPPSRPPDEIRYGEWEPNGDPYSVTVNLNEGLGWFPLWVQSTKQRWHRRRMERWYEGGELIGRWTWEDL